MVIQKRESDLVLATFGRGFYVLDDYSPLRTATPETLKEEAVLFPVKNALEYVQSSPIGGRGKGFQGENFYTADNPAFGATFTYYLRDGAAHQNPDAPRRGARSGAQEGADPLSDRLRNCAPKRRRKRRPSKSRSAIHPVR